MQTFTYPFYAKLIYRFGNVFATIFLVLHQIPLVLGADENLYLLIPLIISLWLLYYVNKKYLALYKVMPYKIEADDEKIICTDFIFSDKEVIIYYKDIDSLSGGIFEAKIRGVMKVCDGKNKICIGFSERMKDSKTLMTSILSKVRKEIYDEVIERLSALKKVKKK